MDGTQLVSSFDTLVSSFDKETKELKCIASMRGLTDDNCPEAIHSQFAELEGSLTDIEKRVSDLDDYLDNELHSLSELTKLNNLIHCQTDSVNKVLDSTPTCFKVVSENDAPSAISAPVTSMVALTHTTINETSFLKVPTATRGRHTLQSMNVAWMAMNKLFETKHKKVISQTQNSGKIGGVLAPSVSSVFLTETELRSTSIYEVGASSGNAILQTLRALGLVRVVRQQKESCYYKC